jgi:hypothetical protein
MHKPEQTSQNKQEAAKTTTIQAKGERSYLSYAISPRSQIRAVSISAQIKSSRFTTFFKTPSAFAFSSLETSIVFNRVKEQKHHQVCYMQ